VQSETVRQITNFLLTFSSIVYEAMPFIVLGAVIAGVLEEMVPQRFLARVIPRNRFLSMLIGGLLGLVFPMCECGIIPVMRRLLRKGLPLSTCTAYLLAGPIVNFVVITSTLVAFSGSNQDIGVARDTHPMPGPLMAGLRVGLGYLVAIGTSLLVERLWRREGTKLLMPLAMPRPTDADDNEEGPRRTPWQKLSNISETALHDFVDITAFLILGALLAAFTRQWLGHEQIAELGTSRPVLAIVAMMGLAILLCLCSEADAFVAASFTTLPAAAKLAFLVLGPMMDLKLYLMYTRVFRRKLIWTIFGSVMLQVLVYTVITHFVWTAYADRNDPDPAGAPAAAAAQP
jgi:uncharacterized membrane protein YraQ (UPF0718 family)